MRMKSSSLSYVRAWLSMMRWNPARLRDLLRLATFWAIAVWQGGFVFYTGFVLKIGSRELKSDLEQGFITRRVTLELEQLGWIALILWATSLLGTRFSRPSLRVSATVLWCAILACHVGLNVQWHAVDCLLDVANRSVTDPDAFVIAHRIFMWVASLQWLLVVILSGLTLQAWQRQAGQPEQPG